MKSLCSAAEQMPQIVNLWEFSEDAVTVGWSARNTFLEGLELDFGKEDLECIQSITTRLSWPLAVSYIRILVSISQVETDLPSSISEN